MSAADCIHDFVAFMEAEGVRPVEPIAHRLASEDVIRFRCEGDGRGRLNGWAKLFLDDRPAGRFGNFRLGIGRTWSSAGDNRALSSEERAALRKEWAEAKQRRAEEKARNEREAALDAIDMWQRAEPASADHHYVAKKRLDPSPLRQLDGKLLVPMMDSQGKLWNLQRIAGDGTKRFLRGGRVEGLFNLIAYGVTDSSRWCIGEGYATCAAIHRASGYPCIVCFSAKNMMIVGRIWNAARPDLNYIVCADDDPELEDNPHVRKNLGVVTARALAEEIGAKLAVPRAPERSAA